MRWPRERASATLVIASEAIQSNKAEWNLRRFAPRNDEETAA
jgi:hypothetical protein